MTLSLPLTEQYFYRPDAFLSTNRVKSTERYYINNTESQNMDVNVQISSPYMRKIPFIQKAWISFILQWTTETTVNILHNEQMKF